MRIFQVLFLLLKGFWIVSSDPQISEKYIVLFGEDVVLPCQTDPGVEEQCAWTKVLPGSGSVVITVSGDDTIIPPATYELIGNPKEGDCTLKITKATFEDSGKLTCKFYPSGNFHLIDLETEMKPEEPFIMYKNQTVLDGEDIYVDQEDIERQQMELVCIVPNGRPKPLVFWRVDGFGFDSDKVLLESNNDYLVTVLSYLTLQPKSGTRIKCIAYHPTQGHQAMKVSATIKNE